MPVVTAITAGLSMLGAAVGVGTAAAGFGAVAGASLSAVLVGGAIVGAVIGGTVAAIKGESILKGALTGGLIGAAAGGALGLAAGAIAGEALPLLATSTAETGVAAASVTPAASTEAIMVGEGATAAQASVQTAAMQQAARETATQVGGKGLLGGLTKGMTGSDKALLLSAGAGAISSMAGPDEEELLEKEAKLREKALRIDLPDTETGRFRGEYISERAMNRFSYEDTVQSKLPQLDVGDIASTDTNVYRPDVPRSASRTPTRTRGEGMLNRGKQQVS